MRWDLGDRRWREHLRRRRVGYIAYQGGALGEQLLKVQDTIPICPPQLSQHLALGAVSAGRPWVAERVAAIAGNRRAIFSS